MRIYPMPTSCPACSSRLRVSGLVCSNPDCRTEIKGEYEANEFALLPPEPLEFLRLYIKSGGNLKKVESILGVSYPTVRARFKDMLYALGYEMPDEPEPPQPDFAKERSDILSALERGEITAEEAGARLRALKRGR
ncbi:Protein of unknown function DUF2089 [Allomeiothermus silvanus DSM 9946]|uniref:DUF2089 domain-containing protein n=1 Tax=Allomeiothermus silvanus (strain ATCC 700542 / DSM 9946 / NBRC 106475 / NCIMB 13440 / VI-R2) TaxID=526227 RepID=D7BBM6_ALLS1|nr:DUF2089 domain-containing protein [Allomeiothermus silvanus]ADH64488.1 Protein of unknown function DUF2089 [Allomeiothermus silvanus DSM 9946]